MYLGNKDGRYTAKDESTVDAHSTVHIEEVESIGSQLLPLITATAFQVSTVLTTVGKTLGTFASKMKPIIVKVPVPVPVIVTKKQDKPYIVQVDAPVTPVIMDEPVVDEPVIPYAVLDNWSEVVRREDAQRRAVTQATEVDRIL